MDKVAERINKLHRSVHTYKTITLHAMTEIGKLLTQKKYEMEGFFLEWLKTNVKFSERTAHKYMRVYRLSKTPFWDKKKSVARNLKDNSEPQTYKQVVNNIKARDIAKKVKIPVEKAKEIVSAIEKHPEIKFITRELTETQVSKIRLNLFTAMERAYDLGRRNKLLSMNEKRETLDKLLKIINDTK